MNFFISLYLCACINVCMYVLYNVRSLSLDGQRIQRLASGSFNFFIYLQFFSFFLPSRDEHTRYIIYFIIYIYHIFCDKTRNWCSVKADSSKNWPCSTRGIKRIHGIRNCTRMKKEWKPRGTSQAPSSS